MGIQINDPDFLKKLKIETGKLNKDKNAILSSIKLWVNKIKISSKSNIEKKQKTKEVIDLGHFLYNYDPEIKITDILIESPDCIVQKNDSQIGIEIKDLIIQEREKKIEGTIKSIFNKIELELSENNEKYKGIYRIEFFNETLSLKRKDKKKIKSEILGFIKTGTFISKNEIVKKIRKTPHKKVHLYKGEATIVGRLEQKIVLDRIKSKEKNVKRYANSGDFDELWLLLIIGGVQKSSNYSHFEESITKDVFESNFDKIFIYDFFNKQITELKIRNTKNQLH